MMKKTAMVGVLAVGLLFVSVSPSFAWWHRGWWGPGFWVVPPPVVVVPAPAPVVVAPAPVIVSPPAYAQQEPAEAQSYWYFCPSSKAYYPSVQSCSDAWIKVPPRAQ